MKYFFSFHIGKTLAISRLTEPGKPSSEDASKLVREWQFKAVLELEGVSRELMSKEK